MVFRHQQRPKNEGDKGLVPIMRTTFAGKKENLKLETSFGLLFLHLFPLNLPAVLGKNKYMNRNKWRFLRIIIGIHSEPYQKMHFIEICWFC